MYALNTLTDEDLGLVLNGTDWLTSPLDTTNGSEIQYWEDIFNVPFDPLLADLSATAATDDLTPLDLSSLSWLDNLQSYTDPPPPPVAEPSPSTDPPSPPLEPTPDPFSTPDARWQAVLSRTPTNSFVYGVVSTKIYCRPTCPSRRPHRTNVIFFDTPAEGNKANYRACKRCRPEDEAGEAAEQRQSAAVERAKAFIEAKSKKGERVGLEKLASEAGLSTFYFHRVFKRRVGVTPEEWGKMCRQRWAG